MVGMRIGQQRRGWCGDIDGWRFGGLLGIGHSSSLDLVRWFSRGPYIGSRGRSKNRPKEALIKLARAHTIMVLLFPSRVDSSRLETGSMVAAALAGRAEHDPQRCGRGWSTSLCRRRRRSCAASPPRIAARVVSEPIFAVPSGSGPPALPVGRVRWGPAPPHREKGPIASIAILAQAISALSQCDCLRVLFARSHGSGNGRMWAHCDGLRRQVEKCVRGAVAWRTSLRRRRSFCDDARSKSRSGREGPALAWS